MLARRQLGTHAVRRTRQQATCTTAAAGRGGRSPGPGISNTRSSLCEYKVIPLGMSLIPRKGSAPTVATRTATREIEGRDSVGMYLDEIARTPLLDAITEVELSKTIEAGLLAEHLLAEGRVGRKKGGAPKYATQEELEWLASEGQQAIQRFIEANLRLVVSIARKYGRSQMPMLDLVQEGNTGLIRAVEKFDYAKGFKFSTYATWWVRQAITRGIAQQARVVR